MRGVVNQSSIEEFILCGLTEKPYLQIVLFALFLLLYIFTILGNTGIMVIMKVDPSLSTPMYFFLHHLSFSDLFYSSVITPEMLVNVFRQRKSISLIGCAAQMFIFVTFGAMECFLLGIMTYDRYYAICKPFFYSIAMNSWNCNKLLASAYFGSVTNALVHTIATFSLSFCKSNIIKHFHCDIPPLLSLFCSDTTINQFLLVIFGILTSWFPLIIILISYGYIISTAIKIQSGQGQFKVFSTCSSHFTAVSMFYGALFFMYFRPAKTFSVGQDSVVSIFYTIMIPMLNPLINSLRNQDVREPLKKISQRVVRYH